MIQEGRNKPQVDVDMSIRDWFRPFDDKLEGKITGGKGASVAIRLTKSPPPPPSSPTITFTHQRNVQTLARLLAECRGKQSPRDRFFGLIFSFLIFDHYAEAYKAQTRSRARIGQSWKDLANDPEIQAIYVKVLPWEDEAPLGEIELDLPITSVSAFQPGSAPKGIKKGKYALKHLCSSQFAEIAWVVRCNLLHGSYDPCNADTFSILFNVSRPMMAIVWEMLKQTQR